MQTLLPSVVCTPNSGRALNTEYQTGNRLMLLTVKCFHQVPANVGLKIALVGVYWNTVSPVIAVPEKELGLVGVQITPTVAQDFYTSMTVVIPKNVYWQIINYDTNGANSTIGTTNEVLI